MSEPAMLAVPVPDISYPAFGAMPDHDPVEVATVLRDLSNPCRLRTLCALCDGEYYVGELEAKLGMTQSALSQHLARLRQARLVRTRRDQQRIFYGLSHPSLRPLIEAVAATCSEIANRQRDLDRLAAPLAGPHQARV